MQQQSLNREVFERKISQVYDSIEIGDMKKASKQINTLLDKGEKKMSQVEKIAYRIVKVYVLEKSNKRQEALTDVDEIINEILTTNVTDPGLLDQLDVILQEIGCYDKLLQLREHMSKKHPQDHQLTSKLFTLYTYQNDYQKMSSKATFLEKALNSPDYGLIAIQSLYLNSQVKGASPMLINLAIGYLEKQRQQRESGTEPLPQYFVQLYCKILLKKGDYDKVLEFLSKHEKSFGIVLDQRKLIFKALYKKGDKVGAINELITIIKDNYEKIEQFQSLYDLHELLISLVVDLCLTKGMKHGVTLNFIAQELDQMEIKDDTQLFQTIAEQGLLHSVQNLYSSFKKYDSIDLDNKSMNYHNCRKASILSQLLIKSKLLSVLCEDAIIDQFVTNGDSGFNTLLIAYAERYIELNSMIFDLYPYIPFLSHKSKQDITSALQERVDSVVDEVRKARGVISLYKVKKVFGLLNEENNLDYAFKIVEQMHLEYLKILDLDQKPAKGERKMADDLVILMNEILEPYFEDKIDATVLFRIGIMEFAMERSPYNFDIQLQLLKLYDILGLSASFNSAFNSLGCKGVQLESMGYLQVRHSIDWAEINQFKQFTLKFNKYQKFNLKNLKECKARSFSDNNYDQIENFIEYEEFLLNSYFSVLMKFVQYLSDFSENIQSQEDFSKSFFQNMVDQLRQTNTQVMDFSEEGLTLKKTRTQDLRISDNQYTQINEYKTFRQSEKDWIKEFEKDDFLKEVTNNDKVYSFFKYDRKSNYKSNLSNSLGVFEHPQIFSLLFSLMTTLAEISTSKDKLDAPQLVDKLKIQFEITQKTLAELDIYKRQDTGLRYKSMIESLLQMIENNIAVLDIVGQVSKITKKQGQPGDEVLTQLLPLKDSIAHLVKNLAPQASTSDLRLNFLQTWIVSTFLSISFGILNQQLKSILPSQKQKKKGSAVQEEVQASVLSPLKQNLKDISNHFGSLTGKVIDEELIRSEYSKLQDLRKNFSPESHNVNKEVHEIIQRKIIEISKEQKLTNDRLKELSLQISKRFKELATSGFQ